MYHTILEDAFPLVLDTCDLVVSAENNVSLPNSSFLVSFLVSGVRVIQVTINGLIVRERRA